MENVGTDVMGFDDATAVAHIGDQVAPGVSQTDTTSALLGDYLGRWTLINTSTWLSTVTTGQQIANLDVWKLFLANPFIASKVYGYYKIRATLELNVILTAAPTQYGHFVVNCIPQGTEGLTPDVCDTYNGSVPDTADALPTISQCCHEMYGDLGPALSESLHFTLPWIAPFDALDLTSLSSVGVLGGGPQTQWRVLYQCIAPLGNATNMINVPPVTIKMYARLLDVQLDVPLQMQAGKHPQGKIGKAAAAVTKVSGMLKSAPVIGAIASGVEVVSSAIGAVADFFGFTKDPNPMQAELMRPYVAPAACNIDTRDTGTVVSLNSANAVSIDPSEFGVSGGVDVESFAEIFKKKTLYTTATWTTSQSAGTLVANWDVTPQLTSAMESVGVLQFGPVGYVANAFSLWRGPMYYEIRVMCSSLHRGRLQIVYDPPAINASTPALDPTNTTFNQVFDINADQNLTFKVGYIHPRPMLPLQSVFEIGNGGAFNAVSNGKLRLLVNTELTAPDPAASVTVEIWFYSDGDMQFAQPRGLSGFVLQAGPDVNTDGAMQTVLNELVPSKSVDVSAVVSGERIQSIRGLLQRFTTPGVLQATTTSGEQAVVIGVANDTIMPGAFLQTPWHGQADWGAYDYIQYFTRLYVGYRGSMRYKLVTSEVTDLRGGVFGPDWSLVSAFDNPIPLGMNQWTTADRFDFVNMTDSFQLYPTALGGTPEFTIPYFSTFKFRLGRYSNPSDNLSDDMNVALVGMATLVGEVNVIPYRAAGADFSLGRFRFVPKIKAFPAPS